jgi:hypothetical protein
MRKHHKEDSSGWEISFRKSSVRGSIPKDISVRGSSPRWKYTFSIDDKGGEIYQMQSTQRHGSRGRDGHRGSMSDMTSVLHQSVSINAKGGDC